MTIPGAKIRQIRDRLGETQEEFAARLRTTRWTVLRWEADGIPEKVFRDYLSIRTVMDLADAQSIRLGTTVTT